MQHVVDSSATFRKRWRPAGVRVDESNPEQRLHRRFVRLRIHIAHHQRVGPAAPNVEQRPRLILARRAAVGRMVKVGVDNGVRQPGRLDLDLDGAPEVSDPDCRSDGRRSAWAIE